MGNFVGTAALAWATDVTPPTLTFTQADLGVALQAGDVLVASLRGQSAQAGVDWSVPNFTRVGPEYVPNAADGRQSGLYLHTVTDPASEPASYVFSTVETDTGAARRVGVLAVYRPAAGMVLEPAGFAPSYAGTAITNGKSQAAFPVTTPTLLLAVAGGEHVGTSHIPATLPTGFTTIGLTQTGGGTSTTGSRTSAWLGARTLETGTQAPALSIVWPAAVTAAHFQVVALHEVVPAPPAGAPVELADGTPAQAFYWDGDVEVPVTQLLALPHRGYTVAEMDADIAAGRPVYWAHRGGSANWPEMTMRAYTNAIWHGVKALEISMYRSTDGVWIMSHDGTLQRVTGQNIDIFTSPSSAMLGLPVTVGGGGGVIGRVEDVIEAYRDFVLIIDNKQGAYFGDMLDLLEDAIPDVRNHVIIKIDGQYSADVNWALAKSRGFKVAGYWYPDNWETRLPPRLQWTDYIGMQHDASAATWTALQGYGKPIWGHILQTQAQLNAAAAGGADIFQCANVKTLVPRVNLVA